MLRLLPKRTIIRPVFLQQTCKRSFHSSNIVKNKSKEQQETDDAWEHANVDRSTISNQVVPQPASDAIPNSMMSAFHNMFDRGPNVGIEVITKHGFVLSNHIKIDQPLILLNGSPFLDLEAFKIFEIVSPRPELIMFGTGKEFAPIPEHIRKYFFKLGIQVDQMNSVSKIMYFYV
jgi:NADH dehydrogenase [ubiquinone] 1 alpha subcomplex assembly factor 3